MLSQKDQKKIRLKLRNIYSKDNLQFNINHSLREIVEIINKFNKKKNKKKKIISEKTSVVICYGDSILSNKPKNLIRTFHNFFQKKLKNLFNTVHFLPFYPSSSDSGFAVKDHYKIDTKLGNWSDISKFSKKN